MNETKAYLGKFSNKMKNYILNSTQKTCGYGTK